MCSTPEKLSHLQYQPIKCYVSGCGASLVICIHCTSVWIKSKKAPWYMGREHLSHFKKTHTACCRLCRSLGNSASQPPGRTSGDCPQLYLVKGVHTETWLCKTKKHHTNVDRWKSFTPQSKRHEVHRALSVRATDGQRLRLRHRSHGVWPLCLQQ